MKNFTLIPNEIGALFVPNDVYTITVMYLTAKTNNNDSHYVTDVTREQLANLTGLSIGYIKNEFLPRLKKSNFCLIKVFTDSNHKLRNKYYLPKPDNNFRIINKRIIEDNNLTPKEKGIIISLFTVCENNTFNCGLEDYIILDKLKKISRTTLYRQKMNLKQKNYLRIFDDENLYYHFNYCKCIEINCNWIGSTSDNLIDLETGNYKRASTYSNKYCFFIKQAA